MPINTLIELRADLATTWTAVNPVLSRGEVGVETDSGNMKIGDGVTPYNGLSYSTDPALWAALTTTITATVNIISGVGNLSGAYTLDLSAPALNTIAGTGTLVGDTTITVTNYSAGSQATMTLVQDSVGSHALSVTAGGQTITPTIPTSGAFFLNIACTDTDAFVEIASAAIMAGTVLPIWTGTIRALVSGQLDTSVWPYQSVTSGNLAVLTDPLAVKGTILSFAIPETG